MMPRTAAGGRGASSTLAEEDATSDKSSEDDGKSLTPQNKPATASKKRVKRLGIRELGWFAHEKAMPSRILERIDPSNGIDVAGIIPVLARLCLRDTSVKETYLCHPEVHYITKTRGEGSFCGYRNIQMLISFVIGSKTHGYELFPDGVPSILQLQDKIESAWDRGINAEGRVETGGIRGTRKHIGTPEAQACFKGLGISCSTATYQNNPVGAETWHWLLGFVEGYFRGGSSGSLEGKVYRTALPPIYLQQPRHSMTIVGFEAHTDGKSNLLVLDPALRPEPSMVSAAKDLVGEIDLEKGISLKSYRRGKGKLGRYKRFEILTLISPARVKQ